MFDVLMSLKADIALSNERCQPYLLRLLLTVLVSLIVLVMGILFSFIQIRVFVNNASDLFLMACIAIYVLVCAARTTEQFNAIGSVLTTYYHQQKAFVGWDTEKIIQFLSYASKDKSGFKLCGVLLDFGTVMRFVVVLLSGFLSTFGKRFYG